MSVGFRRWKSHTVYRIRRNSVSVKLKIGFYLLCAVYLFCYVQKKTLPMFYALAENKIRDLGTEMTEHSIQENEWIGTVEYDRLMTVQTNASGQICSLEANGSLLNQIRTSLMESILKKMDLLRGDFVKIPLGSFSGSPFFAGMGPDIPVKIVPYGSVDIDFQSVFTSAGVNQTKHEINMLVMINMNVFFPGKTLDINLEVPVLMTETVIAGEIPKTYLDCVQDLETLDVKQ